MEAVHGEKGRALRSFVNGDGMIFGVSFGCHCHCDIIQDIDLFLWLTVLNVSQCTNILETFTDWN